MSLQKLTFKVTGQVQGVNYRSWAQQQATRLGLSGFVRNTSDGAVEGQGIGDKEALDQLVKHLHQGPSLAAVSEVQSSWSDAPQGEDQGGFEVRA